MTYSSGTLRLYTRPLRVSYADHDLFDATANPDGWRLVFSGATDLPATPMFFNASGTEGQLMAGERLGTRVKIRIAGAVASLETRSALGEGTRSSPGTHDRVYESNITRGTPAGCFFNGECTAGPGTCLVDGRPRTLACTRSELDVTVIEREIFDSRGGMVTWERPTVVCADYRGDQEVLCTLEAESLVESRSEMTVRWHRDFVRQQEGTSCGLQIVSSSLTRDYTSTETRVDSQRRTLKMGNVAIPISGFRTESLSNAVTHINGDLNNTNGSAAVVRTKVDPIARIYYLDARNGIAVYELEEEIEERAARSNAAPVIPNFGVSYQWNTVWEIETTRRVRTLASMAGQEIELDARPPVVSRSTSPVGLSGGLATLDPPPCTPSFRRDFDPQPQPFVDAHGFLGRIHAKAFVDNEPVSQAYAVDASGRVVASQTIWMRPPSGGDYQAVGVWNFLTGGDLPTVIPGSITNPAYFPAGVVR